MSDIIEKFGQKSIFCCAIPMIEAGLLVPTFKHLNWFVDTFFQKREEKVLIAKGKIRHFVASGELDAWFISGFHLVRDDAKIIAYLQHPLLARLERIAELLNYPIADLGGGFKGFTFTDEGRHQELTFGWANDRLGFSLMPLEEGEQLAGGDLGDADSTPEGEAKLIKDTLIKYQFKV